MSPSRCLASWNIWSTLMLLWLASWHGASNHLSQMIKRVSVCVINRHRYLSTEYQGQQKERRWHFLMELWSCFFFFFVQIPFRFFQPYYLWRQPHLAKAEINCADKGGGGAVGGRGEALCLCVSLASSKDLPLLLADCRIMQICSPPYDHLVNNIRARRCKSISLLPCWVPWRKKLKCAPSLSLEAALCLLCPLFVGSCLAEVENEQ